MTFWALLHTLVALTHHSVGDDVRGIAHETVDMFAQRLQKLEAAVYGATAPDVSRETSALTFGNPANPTVPVDAKGADDGPQ